MEHISEPSSMAEPSAMLSRWQQGLRSPLTLGLVSCGAIGAVLFTLTNVLEGITRPGYDVKKGASVSIPENGTPDAGS